MFLLLTKDQEAMQQKAQKTSQQPHEKPAEHLAPIAQVFPVQATEHEAQISKKYANKRSPLKQSGA